MTDYAIDGNKKKVLIGVAVGTAVGVGLALSRRRSNRWSTAKTITKKMAENSGDFADAIRGILDRVQHIYEESRKVVEDASELWGHGRRLVRS